MRISDCSSDVCSSDLIQVLRTVIQIDENLTQECIMATVAEKSLPAHVPPELAIALPLFSRKTIFENPQETLIPHMHETLPPICYVTNIFPGDQPGWLLKHAEDVQVMLRDPDNFTKNGMGKWAQNIGEDWRSEEHTSELQSLMRNSYAVFCLKKNKRI